MINSCFVRSSYTSALYCVPEGCFPFVKFNQTVRDHHPFYPLSLLTEAAINDTCYFNEQCEAVSFQTECRDRKCICRFEMTPIVNKDGSIGCQSKSSWTPLDWLVACFLFVHCVELRLTSLLFSSSRLPTLDQVKVNRCLRWPMWIQPWLWFS